MTITEFLTERIDEDEAVALAANGDRLRAMAQRGDTVISDAAFLQAFTVKHVLGEVEAKRRIVQRYREIQEDRAGLMHYGVTTGAVKDRAEGMQLAALMAVADLAAIYADRPGWREEWRPAALWSSLTRVWAADDPETP